MVTSDEARSPRTTDSGGRQTRHVEPAVVTSKVEFAALLRQWMAGPDAHTLGDIGTFGRRPILRLATGDGRVVSLNADTKRAAVREYLDDVARAGAGAPWRVLTNRNGVVNRVDFRLDGPPTPGWYCYLDPPAQAEGSF